MKTTARKKILGIMKNSPNSVGTLEDFILVCHLIIVVLKWATWDSYLCYILIIFGIILSSANLLGFPDSTKMAGK